MANTHPMCMDPPKKRFTISLKSLTPLILIILVIFIALPVPPKEESEVILFSRSIENHLEIDYLIETQNGCFVFTVSEQLPDRCLTCVVKTDRYGKMEWNTTLPVVIQSTQYTPDIPDIDIPDNIIPLHYIHETASGNFLISSYIDRQPLLIMISNTGEILWTIDSIVDKFPDLERSPSARIIRILENSEGEFLITGGFIVIDPPYWAQSIHFDYIWFAKVSQQGIREMYKKIPTNTYEYSEHIRDVWITPTDEIIIATTSNKIMKFSKEGILQWNKTLEGFTHIYDLEYGYESYNAPLIYYLKTGFLVTNGTKLLKLNFEGESEWSIEFIDTDHFQTFGHLRWAFLIFQEEYFLICNPWVYAEGYVKYLIFKVSASGDFLWQREILNPQVDGYGHYPHNSGNEYPCGLFHSYEGNQPVFLTADRLLIFGESLVGIDRNTGIKNQINLCSYREVKIELKDRELNINSLFQLSESNFITINHKATSDEGHPWGGGGSKYVNNSFKIFSFDSELNLLWPENITVSFDYPNPTRYLFDDVLRIKKTLDKGVIFLIAEYNNTESEYPFTLMKISKNGIIEFLESYLFTDFGPFTIISNYPSYDYINNETTINSTSRFELIFILPSILVIILFKKRRKL